LKPLPSAWIPRAAIGFLVSAGAFVAWRAGGGADARVAPPGPAVVHQATPDASIPTPAGGHGDEGYEVRTRLTDALAGAKIDVPSLGAAMPALQGYWRRMPDPWSRPTGLAGRLVMTVSLLTSEAEAQWRVPTHAGGAWTPQARVWNMNEGSFDQREAIFAPTPCRVTFHIDVPPRAHLRASPGLIAPFSAATTFDVIVVDAAGAEHTLSETHVPGGDTRDAHGWHDVDVDLSPWGGQTVDLRLETSTEHPGETTRRHNAAGADAGAEEGLAALSPASLALWGDPLLLAREPTRLPYDVLWIVVDALRPDVAAGLHDADEDRAKLAAHRAPLEALLPAIPGLMPSIDALAARGVHFQHAWSAGAWTRPGTLAMLSGERTSELGVDTTSWVVPTGEAARFYASDPPLLPLVLRRSGAVTAAFVNNFFMSGQAAVGLDMGFERVTDHRYRTRDTAEIAHDAVAWLDAHAADRFFLFVNFNSPHEPFDPERAMLARIPAAPDGPRDVMVRWYMAEAAKDDAAIGEILQRLDTLGLTRSTLVVLTADHGETLSSAHQGFGLGHMPMRFHHAVGNFEETTRIPIVMALPGLLDGGRTIRDRVRNVDMAPTVLEVEGLEPDARMSGRSMLPLTRGQDGRDGDARAVLSEGRASRGLIWEQWHLIVHQPVRHEAARGRDEGPPGTPTEDAGGPPMDDQLFDLNDDPGERRNVARQHPDVVETMKARMTAALANVPAADAPPPVDEGAPPSIHLRFSGAGLARRVSGTLLVGDGSRKASVVVEPSGIAADALRVATPAEADGGPGGKTLVEFALTTSPDQAVGFDLRVDPASTPVTWRVFLDDAPLPDGAVFAGPFGLPAAACKGGLASDEARDEAAASAPPLIDPSRDIGMFVARDRPGDRPAGGAEPGRSVEADRETQRVLEQWGYAHPDTKKR
jgi:arylsulfatase A-like enzyme